MKTISEILQHCASYLEKRGVDRSRREAEDLLCDALGLKRMDLYLQHDRPLVEAELTSCRERLMRRGKGEPLAYIHGEVVFYGCRIAVTPAVLIPRQETELLVDLVVTSLASQDLSGKVLWDICCGSGCIGIAIKKRLPQLDVVLSDVSEEALKLARQNAARNEVEVAFRAGDLLAPFANERAHFVVCNPPYVTENEYATLPPGVRDFEPRLALVGGSNGLQFYERLAKELNSHLQPGASAWFEIGEGQGDDIRRLFGAQQVAIQRDWAGKERFAMVNPTERT